MIEVLAEDIVIMSVEAQSHVPPSNPALSSGSVASAPSNIALTSLQAAVSIIGLTGIAGSAINFPAESG